MLLTIGIINSLAMHATIPPNIPTINTLRHQISQCEQCINELPFAPNPVIQIDNQAQLLIIGQAPGTKVHETGIPWNDPSGDRLRHWLEMEREQFYNPKQVAIMPMGFCYPGKGKSGDLPPRPECAPLWHQKILNQLPNIKLTLLIGQYAQNYYLSSYLPASEYKTLSARVRAFEQLPEHLFPLPHPSPRNRIWLMRNPWFEQEVIPQLRQRLRTVI